KWNLHKEPGFWRQYNRVEKLARVLATEAQARRRYAFSTSSSADLAASAPADDAAEAPREDEAERPAKL
ncbi:MAG: hypothetical protein AAFX50_20995, partial [Acidobacteriota bacterium]